MRLLRCLLAASLVLAAPRAYGGPAAPGGDRDRAATAHPTAPTEPDGPLDKADPPAGTGAATAVSTSGLALSAGATAGIYLALYGWVSLAWFVRTTDSDHFQTHDEGWFGADTYAGGADKLGHAWGNYALVRGVNQLLRYGGWSERASLVASSALALSFFTMSEIKDGYKIEYGFSYGDMIMNAGGNVLAVAMELWPALDRRLDFRISYVPSSDYVRALEREGPFNTPEDYTGQTFFLAYHLGSNAAVTRHVSWARYLDLTLGYRARNYKPLPSDGAPRSQELFLGLSLNAQALMDAVTGRGPGPSVLHFITEMYQPPYTTLRAGGLARTRTPLIAPAERRAREMQP